MDAAGDHGGGKMMRAGDHVGDDFGVGGVGNRRLEDADDGGGARRPGGPFLPMTDGSLFIVVVQKR